MIIGPNGVRILYDRGKRSRKRDIPCFQCQIGLRPEDDIDFATIGLYELDHYVGFGALVDAGCCVRVANNGPYAAPPQEERTLETRWLEPSSRTTVVPVRSIPAGRPVR